MSTDLELQCPQCGAENRVPMDSTDDSVVCVECGSEFEIDAGLETSQEVTDYLVGEVISDCKILEKVGEGGFGSVYRALDQNLQRPVAFKVMLQSLTTNAEFVQKFIREAVTAAQLNHRNIVSIHKVGRDEKRGIHYLIMEFVEGETLNDLLEREGVLSPQQALPIMLQACDALATAHESSIVHRDIKPDNLMLTADGTLKITDFGLAKSLTTNSNTTKVMGTPHYMSPEQFEGKPVDGRSDIYSLGVTFYYLLSKNRPYEGQNTVQIIYSILTQDPKSLLDLNASVPPPLWDVIQKMIAKSVDDRYQTLRQTMEDLRGFQDRHLATRTNCASCGARNPKGRKFCRGCGSALLVTCPACSHLEAAGTKDCSSCGADIQVLVKRDKALVAAKRFQTLGDLRRAAEGFQQVLDLDPSHAEAQAELDEIGGTLDEVDRVRTEAETLAKTGELETALERVSDLLRRYPTAAEVREHRDQLRKDVTTRKVNTLVEEAEQAAESGEVRKAIELLDSALRADPSREDVRTRRSELQSRIGRIAEWRTQAAQAVAAGRFEEAYQLASNVLEVDPDDEAMQEVRRRAQGSVQSVDQFVERGKKQLADGRFREALSEFEAALSMRPGDPELFQYVEDTRLRIKQRREKISLCRRLLAQHEYAQAVQGLEEVLEEYPDDREAKSLLAASREGLAQEQRQRDIKSGLDRGQTLLDEGLLDDALEAFKSVLELDPRNADARTARDELEAKIRQQRDVRELANEHLQDGRYDEAVSTLQRLREINPGLASELDRDIEQARRNEQRVQGLVSKAEQALDRREFVRALEHAGQVLELAPRHPGALAIKKDAEKAQSAIDRFLKECDRLILSELFDEAQDALDKAKERGASGEPFKRRWEECQQGRLALLKADATRSIVMSNFEAAIAAYDQVLELSGDDAEAQRGKRAAVRRIRILTTEPLQLRLGAAAVVLLLLGLVQFQAVASTREAAASAEVETNQEELETRTAVIVDRGKTEPELDAALAAEAAGEWATAITEWRDELDWLQESADRPDRPDVEEGLAFAQAIQSALAESTPQARLEALPAEDQLGSVAELRLRRRVQVGKLRSRFVEQWFEQAAATESAAPTRARELYSSILLHPVAGKADAAQAVDARITFLSGLEGGDSELEAGRYEVAAADYLRARDKMQEVGDADRAAVAQARLQALRDGWVASIREAHRSLDDEQAYYEQVARQIRALAEALGLDRAGIDQVISEITED